jgi:hypothetical protein
VCAIEIVLASMCVGRSAGVCWRAVTIGVRVVVVARCCCALLRSDVICFWCDPIRVVAVISTLLCRTNFHVSSKEIGGSARAVFSLGADGDHTAAASMIREGHKLSSRRQQCDF